MPQLISYYGGKQRIASKIIPLIPKHTVFVEPFCGGATVFFNKPWPEVSNRDHYREIINDKNDYVVSLYREARENGCELFEKLSLTPYSRSEHQKALEIYRNQEKYSQSEKAWSCFVNANMSFSNTLGAGWRTGVFGRNIAATWANKDLSIMDRLKSVHIECDDAIKVIKRWDSPQTFFYCDPPYPVAHQGHYSGYTIEMYQDLINTLDNCQGSFLLSNYECIADIPQDWERFEFLSHCSASGKGKIGIDRSRKATNEELGNRKRAEIVYRRFNRVPVRIEIQQLYESGKFDCFASLPKLGVDLR